MSNRSARGDDCEVIVIGAGPYGLAAAAHLAERGVATQVFGEPMSSWRHNMPQGMKLRSPWGATHIPDPHGELSLDAFVAARGLSRREPLPLETFIDYGMWFQRAAVPDIDTRMILRLEPAGDGFRAETMDGAHVHARRVVVATGFARQAFRPEAFAEVPAELASHASEHDDLGVFHGRRVAVIGRGQSACESAALLHEAGAEVELICRGDVRWLGGMSGAARLPSIGCASGRFAVGVGPFPSTGSPRDRTSLMRMPNEVRMRFNARCLRPGAAGVVASALRRRARACRRAGAQRGGRRRARRDDARSRHRGVRPRVARHRLQSRRRQARHPRCRFARPRSRAAAVHRSSAPGSNRACRGCISSAQARSRATAR